jgi:hypothetical protein
MLAEPKGVIGSLGWCLSLYFLVWSFVQMPEIKILLSCIPCFLPHFNLNFGLGSNIFWAIFFVGGFRQDLGRYCHLLLNPSWEHHTVALPFTLKSILRQKKNYGNSNISPWKNYNLQKNPLKETKILQDIITL